MVTKKGVFTLQIPDSIKDKKPDLKGFWGKAKLLTLGTKKKLETAMFTVKIPKTKANVGSENSLEAQILAVRKVKKE